MAATKNILIFGATGLIGSRISKAILDSKNHWSKVAVFTSPQTVRTKPDEIAQFRKQGVEIIEGDITSEADIHKAYSGIDTVVSCVGRPVIDKQLLLIKLADKHPDVKRFFPSEFGTDIEYWPSSADEKPHQLKLKVRALLKTVEKLEYTYVVTGPYGDADGGLYLAAKSPEREEEGSFDVGRKRAVLLGDGNGKISLTTMRDVGKLVVAALLHPEAAKNKALHVNSFTTTPKELAEEFQRQTGSKWDISYTSLDRLKELEDRAWKDGIPAAGPLTLRRIWTSGGTLYDERDNRLIGMEGKTDNLKSAVELAISVQKNQQQ